MKPKINANEQQISVRLKKEHIKTLKDWAEKESRPFTILASIILEDAINKYKNGREL